MTLDFESLSLEIAHVLFIDIVGYSKRAMDQQPRTLAQLQDIVRQTDEFKGAVTGNRLISLPTGDGMALVFFVNPVTPLLCALQITKQLKETNGLELRMGIHSGPVYRMPDINANLNVAGGGINFAKRVMDCADAGHILISQYAGESLSQFQQWRSSLHDLGEIEVKHGEKLRIYNFHNEEFGNPTVPSAFENQTSTPTRPISLVPPRTSPGKFRIVLLCESAFEPDSHLVQTLWEGLNKLGHNVFIGRNLAVGLEWVQAIEYQLRSADAAIPVLSATSVTSETLAYEVQIAKEIKQQADGKPLLIPLVVRTAEPFVDPWGIMVPNLPYVEWRDTSDDAVVISKLNDLLSPASPLKKRPIVAREPVGGSVPLDSRFYIVRSTDLEFHNAIKRHDSIVLIKGARQMGKTSLLARGIKAARALRARVVLTDFQKLNTQDFESIKALYLALGAMIADQLELETYPEQVWKDHRGPSINFERFIRLEVLKKIPGQIVWGLDEVDRLFTCPFGAEVFGLFRSWHNERSLDPGSSWDRLSLAIVYATEAHLFITDPNQSPFNVGTRLELSDFTMSEVTELNARYGKAEPLQDAEEIASFFNLVGGHPYLVRKGLDAMVGMRFGFEQLDKLADKDEGPFADHLRRILFLLGRDPHLCNAVREVLQHGVCSSSERFYRLRSAGILLGESNKEAKLRCRLYARFLERHF